MDRRSFIRGAAGLLVAPALVRASSLDYVPRGKLLLPATEEVWMNYGMFGPEGWRRFDGKPIQARIRVPADAVAWVT